MTDAEMWGIWGEAATMLDISSCDWRTLQQIEVLLRSLSTSLEPGAEAVTVRPHHGPKSQSPDVDLRRLQGSLAWVREHEYDALESELQTELDAALRYARGALDRPERPQHQVRPISIVDAGLADAR